MLTKLLARFPEYTIVDRPAPEVLTRYRDRVPPELLEVWEQYGFGTFCDGYLKVVNPDDYADLLADTYQLTSTPAPAPPVVLFATGMGDLIIWERGYLVLVDYRHGHTGVVGKDLKLFFRNLSDGGETLAEEFFWEPYPAARERLGEPAFDECFGYVPLLALGGPETVEHLEKVKLREHIFLISQFTGILER
ncbi:T6SS immunity protein Tdi1 domain-containing protein [Hymenobacter terrenus]|uniref:T6SS immunity protein Tdi1 domain-containing protein n=1 Tax=Hymenobacter terrenus TaxID=1629124 RepID=UPI000696E330|nr:T6SS immunity protein Tdi1 domain-containing protein [Hymenobacter terrenus]